MLLAQRPKGKSHPHHWEFPGGKKMAYESLAQALCRELNEELGLTLSESSMQFIGSVEAASIHLHLFTTPLNHPWTPKEHEGIAWVAFDKIKNFLLCPLDKKALDLLSSKIEDLFTNVKNY